MKKSKFTEQQIVTALREVESGGRMGDICRKLGVSTKTFYNWKAKYQGIDVSELKKMRELEQENSKLRRLVAQLSVDNMALKDVLTKKW
jgi:putative transposase